VGRPREHVQGAALGHVFFATLGAVIERFLGVLLDLWRV
jgi:hypothetical protein